MEGGKGMQGVGEGGHEGGRWRGGGEIIGCDPEQEFLAVQQTSHCSNSYLT